MISNTDSISCVYSTAHIRVKVYLGRRLRQQWPKWKWNGDRRHFPPFLLRAWREAPETPTCPSSRKVSGTVSGRGTDFLAGQPSAAQAGEYGSAFDDKSYEWWR